MTIRKKLRTDQVPTRPYATNRRWHCEFCNTRRLGYAKTTHVRSDEDGDYVLEFCNSKCRSKWVMAELAKWKCPKCEEEAIELFVYSMSLVVYHPGTKRWGEVLEHHTDTIIPVTAFCRDCGYQLTVEDCERVPGIELQKITWKPRKSEEE